MNIQGISRAFAALVCGILIIGSTALAQDAKRPGGGRGLGVEQKLNLTDAQRAQIRKNMEQFNSQHAQELAEVKTLREKMNEYKKNNDKTNMQATRQQLQAKMAPLRKGMEDARNSVLTAEQRAQLETLQAEHKGRGQGRRNN